MENRGEAVNIVWEDRRLNSYRECLDLDNKTIFLFLRRGEGRGEGWVDSFTTRHFIKSGNTQRERRGSVALRWIDPRHTSVYQRQCSAVVSCPSNVTTPSHGPLEDRTT